MAQAKEADNSTKEQVLESFAAANNYIVRTARKAHKCDARNARGHGTGACTNDIAVGEKYVEGEMDPYRAGGFGRERYCEECAALMFGRAVIAALEKAQP